MADLLEKGSVFLDGVRHAHLTHAVTYHRAGVEKEIQATVGGTEFEQEGDAGLIQRIESRDFLVRTIDLDLGGGPTLPIAGDQIHEVIDGVKVIYEVNAPEGGGQPPWRYSHPNRRSLRIHTKHIATES